MLVIHKEYSADTTPSGAEFREEVVHGSEFVVYMLPDLKCGMNGATHEVWRINNGLRGGLGTAYLALCSAVFHVWKVILHLRQQGFDGLRSLSVKSVSHESVMTLLDQIWMEMWLHTWLSSVHRRPSH